MFQPDLSARLVLQAYQIEDRRCLPALSDDIDHADRPFTPGEWPITGQVHQRAFGVNTFVHRTVHPLKEKKGESRWEETCRNCTLGKRNAAVFLCCGALLCQPPCPDQPSCKLQPSLIKRGIVQFASAIGSPQSAQAGDFFLDKPCPAQHLKRLLIREGIHTVMLAFRK